MRLEVMDCQEKNSIICSISTSFWDVPVPQRPRSSRLCCKRRLNFDDAYSNSKRSQTHVMVPPSVLGLERISASDEETVKNKEQDKSKEEECINMTDIVGPQTPLPAMRKCALRGGGSLTSKVSRSKEVIKLKKDMQEISEKVEKSHYETRSFGHLLSNAIEMAELLEDSTSSAQLKGRGRRIPQKGKRKLSVKGKATGAWRELLKKGLKLEEDARISVEEFHEKVQSFISKVGHIQGQRLYLPWKGSVLDSVVGAFLTQRVTDNFSSSAFMSLGVSFPQCRDCGMYSRHHRMMREKRSIGDRSCQKQDNKGSKLKLGAERQKPVDEKRMVTLRTGKSPRKESIKPDWETFRTQYSCHIEIERSIDAIDYVDWHAVRRADVDDISNAIILRGMNKKLAKRIKEFLDRLMMNHGNLDLEWIRNVPPLQVKEFLLSVFGLGLKSVQCIQLLTLKQRAFPVDVNVARVTVRLGWVPAPPNISDELLMKILEEVSTLRDLINQYLFPRLCKLDPKTLYELHYQMITFGKVFCTKQKPSCTECPMRKECKKFAEVDIEDSGSIIRGKTQKKSIKAKQELLTSRHEKQKGLEEDPECFCHIRDVEAPKTPLKDQSHLKVRRQGQHLNISSLMGKQPNKSRTRTQHFVYELPDCHPILEKFDDRDPDDPSPYLLVTWESGDPLINSMSSSSLSCATRPQTIPGTIMIPCRTALRGRFPLNGTYFQINEVFADHQTSQMPIDVRRETLQQFSRKILYCGNDLSNIVKGLLADEVKRLFNEGYICTRGFNRETLAPVTLERKLHTLFQRNKRK